MVSVWSINDLFVLSKVYAGLTYKISISFPSNYPYVAPTIKFDTPCYHPNVDITGGAICLDILQVSGWKYWMDIETDTGHAG